MNKTVTEEFNKGTALYVKGKKDEAIIYFKNFSKKYPGLPEPHIALGVIYFNDKNIKEAIKEFKIALELDPENPLVHNNLGNVYKTIGEKEKAIIEYKKSVKIDPNFSLGYVNLSSVYEEMGELKEAFSYLEKALVNTYGLPDKGLSLFFRLAIYYLLFNRLEESSKMLKRILKQTLFKTSTEIVNLRRKCNALLKTIKNLDKLSGEEKEKEIIKTLREFEFKYIVKAISKNRQFLRN